MVAAAVQGAQFVEEGSQIHLCTSAGLEKDCDSRPPRASFNRGPVSTGHRITAGPHRTGGVRYSVVAVAARHRSSR